MLDTIDLIDGLMYVLDADGNGVDAADLATYRTAKRQIQIWAAAYTIDVADAYRRLAAHFEAR